MAKEITLRTILRVDNNDISRNFDNAKINLDQSGTGYIDTYQIIGTSSHELLDIGSVAAPGSFSFMNTSESYPCLIGLDVSGAFHPFASIPPKSFLSGANLGTDSVYAKAVGSDVHLIYSVIEE